jgi:hypothetical protein
MTRIIEGRPPRDTQQKMTCLWKFYVLFVPDRHFCGVSQHPKHAVARCHAGRRALRDIPPPEARSYRARTNASEPPFFVTYAARAAGVLNDPRVFRPFSRVLRRSVRGQQARFTKESATKKHS